MPRLTIALMWWRGWRDYYELGNVNAIARQIREYLHIPYRLVLLTDQDAIGAEVDEIGPLPEDPEGLKLLTYVNCFRRLRFFDPEYSSKFGTEWVAWIDMDTLIRGDITDLIGPALDHPFGMWILRGRWAGRKANERPYNGALCMIKVGEHTNVWSSFDPVESPKAIAKSRWIGSDQCHIGLQVKGAPTFGPEHGMWFFGQYNQRQDKSIEARMINFAGRTKPWSKAAKFENQQIHKEYMRWLDYAKSSKTA